RHSPSHPIWLRSIFSAARSRCNCIPEFRHGDPRRRYRGRNPLRSAPWSCWPAAVSPLAARYREATLVTVMAPRHQVRKEPVTALPLILTVFVACAVEALEALTIVLAAGLTREWRSTFQGMAAALLALAAIVAVLGPTITLLPLTALR